MSRVMTIFGTRPEGIKMMPVINALRARREIETIVAITGQHRHMLDQVFDAFEEKADIDLDIMIPGQSLHEITIRVLTKVSEILAEQEPDLVLVHGDTTTAMASALAAFYARIPVGHVEAGLRSFNLEHPWPEEFNRVAIDSISQYMFAPTQAAAANLQRETMRGGNVFVTGNTGIDALLQMSRLLEKEDINVPIASVTLHPTRSLILVTGHRRESFGEGFAQICEAISRISQRDDVEIVYPVHLNPQVRGPVHELLSNKPNIHLIEPVDYLDIIRFMKRAKIILTDSGGIQEEGPALGRPVLVMRETTERPEALEMGAVKLVGTAAEAICREVCYLLENEYAYSQRARPIFPYGDGTAAQKIATIISERLRT
jgi:UDP-N-acetylglucosamine 2-epimerase (non-hydrolysing)